jgi:hypothetical protein
VARLLAFLSLLVAIPGAPAQNPCAGQKVKLTLVVILAREGGDSVDKKLTAIADEVRLKYPNLTSFRIKSMANQSLAADERATFKLVDDKTVEIAIRHCADKDKRVCLAVIPPDQGEIVYRCVCDKFLPIVTRYRTVRNELLILAIRAQPCTGE